MQDASFRAFPQFNRPEMAALAKHRNRMHPGTCDLFDGPGFPNRIARALAEARAICIKELLEAFEVFERVRHRIRRRHMIDWCCGHGLAGILFATFERAVERVTLIDHRDPTHFHRVRDAILPLAPWIESKVEYRQSSIEDVPSHWAVGAAVLAIHACGGRTDQCLDFATAARAPVAAMPCCYRKTTARAPKVLRRALGVPMTADVHRTYRLLGDDYEVDWAAIPRAITDHNRIIVARPTIA